MQLNANAKPMPRGRRRSHSRGISLIEVLVTMLIFSFGMLGLAGLQIKTLGYSQSSLFRSQATALADDLFDRMRADRTNAKKTSEGGGSWVTTISKPSTSVADNNDLADWKSTVESLLPSGKAAVSVSVSGSDTTVTVELSWDDSRGKDVDADGKFAPQVFKTVTML